MNPLNSRNTEKTIKKAKSKKVKSNSNTPVCRLAYCYYFLLFTFLLFTFLLFSVFLLFYEGRSINKFQNGAIPSVLKIGKIRDIRFVGNLILNIHTPFLDDDVIIVTSSDNRSIGVLFSPSVYYRNSQVINNIRTTKKNEKA